MDKNIGILGSTGVLGKKILSLIKEREKNYRVFALSCNENTDELSRQINEFSPEIVVVKDKNKAKELKGKIGNKDLRILYGNEGYNELLVNYNLSLFFITTRGISLLKPLVNALRVGRKIALANKDIIIAGGRLLMEECRKSKGVLFPVDSEHFALSRLFDSEKKEKIRRIILTASGGAFLRASYKKIKKCNVSSVLRHPVWKMGDKITVDSATLINKALEVIETKFLFDFDEKKIEIVIHPEAIVHCLIEFIDGVTKAILYPPDMRVSILSALHYPEIIFDEETNLNLKNPFKLHFFPPSEKKFYGHKLGHKVLSLGENMPVCLLSANDVAVSEFLNKKLPFIKIVEVIEKTLSNIKPSKISSYEDIEETYKEAAIIARKHIKRKSSL